MCNTSVLDAYDFNITKFRFFIKEFFECDEKINAIRCEMGLVSVEKSLFEGIFENLHKHHA